jgi:hypothetical protein
LSHIEEAKDWAQKFRTQYYEVTTCSGYVTPIGPITKDRWVQRVAIRYFPETGDPATLPHAVAPDAYVKELQWALLTPTSTMFAEVHFSNGDVRRLLLIVVPEPTDLRFHKRRLNKERDYKQMWRVRILGGLTQYETKAFITRARHKALWAVMLGVHLLQAYKGDLAKAREALRLLGSCDKSQLAQVLPNQLSALAAMSPSRQRKVFEMTEFYFKLTSER